MVNVLPVVFLFLSSLILLGSFAQAGTLTGEVREFYNGARSLGMGGTTVAVVNDETALFLNPTGAGRLRNLFVTVLDPETGGGSALASAFLRKVPSSPQSPQGFYDVMSSKPGTYYHLSGQISPSVVLRNFGIGFLYRNTFDGYLSADGTQLDAFSRSDIAFLSTFNVNLFDGRLKVGVTGKAIARIEADTTLNPNVSLVYGDEEKEGLGLGADAGVTLTAPWAWLPTISAVARDIGGTEYNVMKGLRKTTTEQPDTTKQDVDVGLAVFPIHSTKFRSVFSIEGRKLAEASNATDKLRYFHLGYELNTYDILFLRAGVNQRYWTAGVELASQYTQIQIASYGEDIGLDGSPKEDRRFVFKFSFRF